MFQTFSVNVDWRSKNNTEYVMKIMSSINANNQTREWGGEAFLKAIGDEEVSSINLESFSKACTRNVKLAKYKKSKKESNLITQDEKNNGEVGISDVNVQSDISGSVNSDILAAIDFEYYANQFIELRKEIFLKAGVDVWRLLELSRKNDVIAIYKIRKFNNDKRFPNFETCLKDVISQPKTLHYLEELLC